jgi:MtN3 and saliva related transmembrane protein
MYLLFSAGVALWLAYGLMLMLWPVILANSVTLLLALVVIYFKLQEGRHRVPRAPQAG